MREINKKKNRVYAQVKNQLLEKLKWEKFYKFTYAYSSYDNTWSYDSYPKRARKETKKKVNLHSQENTPRENILFRENSNWNLAY